MQNEECRYPFIELSSTAGFSEYIKAEGLQHY